MGDIRAGAIGLLVVAGVAGCGSSTAPKPSGPKLSIAFQDSTIAQGGVTQFSITLPPAAYAGGMPLILTLSGIGSGADTEPLPPDSAGAPLFGQLGVPNGVPDGPVTLTVTLPTLNQTASATIHIKDTLRPAVSIATVTDAIGGFGAFPLPSGYFIVAGLTDTVTFGAVDNGQLVWVGWTMHGAATGGDSARAPLGGQVIVEFPVRVPATAVTGDSVTLTVFATDVNGNRASADLSYTVASITTHPSTNVALGSRVTDVAIDSVRRVAYLARPDAHGIGVLSLDAMTFGTPIGVSGVPVAVDVSPGGDSLIVGLASPASVAVIDLATPAHPVLSVTQLDSGAVIDSLQSLRVAGDGRVISYINQYAVSGSVATLTTELDLATGIVTGIDTAQGANGCGWRPTRSLDRQHVVMLDCPGASVLYASGTHAYSSGVRFGGQSSFYNLWTSASATGSILQFGHYVLDANLTQVLFGGFDPFGGAVIAPNATDFYLSEGDCTPSQLTCPDSLPGYLLHYALPRQQPTELSMIAQLAKEFAITPTGTTLLGFGADSIMAIDLAHSTPASASVLAKFRRRARARQVPLRIGSSRGGALTIHMAGRALRPIPLAH